MKSMTGDEGRHQQRTSMHFLMSARHAAPFGMSSMCVSCEERGGVEMGMLTDEVAGPPPIHSGAAA